MIEYLALFPLAETPDCPPWARRIMVEILTKMAPYMAVEELRRLDALRAAIHTKLSYYDVFAKNTLQGKDT